ncbi:MAG: hypothetical protein ABIH08_01505 [Candidatus Omnitrophota bacterium]
MDKKSISICLLLILACGCVQMRDYTGIRDGAFGFDIKKGLGKGADKKDYLVFKGGVNIIIGDSKDEITAKIGLPNKVNRTLEQEEIWTYEDRKVNLFFKGDKLDNWNLF